MKEPNRALVRGVTCSKVMASINAPISGKIVAHTGSKKNTSYWRLPVVRIEQLMRENNIVPKTVKKWKVTTNSNHDYPVAPNLLDRNFTVESPNMVWISDITCVATGEGWLYLAAVMDLCTDTIVGWAMGERMTANTG